MKRLILSRLWMLISIIILTTGTGLGSDRVDNSDEGFYLD